ncbi:glycoside hydrolase [Guyanagaster necrorhizus]|uniref:Glycoside hydrolase n=1 Tax=Guyanagaster necrorhizus TaxID=856835 RepID=A0A9P8AMJ0_9AGAR|nr:glycoside hydrolase [Guyanagaster necrorhizus MCA 3950]KAG7440794.1 glycoside hydrolase [Guyanagaster necrorhizus MCA 3950]
MLIEVLLFSFAFAKRWGGISVVLAQSATGTSASVSFSITSTLGPTSIPTATASFPPIGSIARDYTPEGLEQLWDLIGPVEPPPFTTTRVPTAAVTLPPSPPPLYPSFYAPAPKDVLPDLKFPNGFIFGVDTAAYQVEGATKNEGKGPTMWDWASRQPGGVADNTTGDVVDLHYFLYKEDVQRTVALGVTAHSFSISWARIYPFGAAGSPVNTAGIDHYSDVINYHWANNLEPVVTLFHWDTPLALQAYYGAFTSPQIVDDFVNYAKTVFNAYNGRVKTWYTFNEPRVFCAQVGSYPFNTTLAPGVNSSSAPYQCTYNLLKAHAGAVKAFRAMNISGEIAFKNDDFIGTPWRSNSSEDALAVERHAAFQIGIFSNPVYTTGDWPDIVKDTLPAEYLPRFTDQEKSDILGSADFYAIDAYRSQWVKAPDEGIDACVANSSDPLWPVCNEIVFYDSDFGWATGPGADPMASWLQATPVAIRSLLQGIHTRWPSNKLYVSEFGFAEPFENEITDPSQIKEDVDRTNYFLTYLGEMLLSIHDDGVPIQGAFSWAMLDNAEWASGTSVKFGIQHVNYTTLERTYKRSALSLTEFFGSHLQN